jgi:hypothetical protein
MNADFTVFFISGKDGSMECANCSHQVAENATVCPSCGHLLVVESKHLPSSIDVITKPRSHPHPAHSSPPPAQKNNLLPFLGITLFVLAGILVSINLMKMQVLRSNAQSATARQTQLAESSLIANRSGQAEVESSQAWFEYMNQANSIWMLWDDAYALADQSNRAELPLYLDNLVSIREDALALPHDRRFDVAHSHMVDAMDYAISAYDDWMSGGAQLDNLLARYRDYRFRWKQEINSIQH